MILNEYKKMKTATHIKPKSKKKVNKTHIHKSVFNWGVWLMEEVGRQMQMLFINQRW